MKPREWGQPRGSWDDDNDSQNIWDTLVAVRKIERELSEERYGNANADTFVAAVLFSREEFAVVQSAAEINGVSVAEWLHTVAVYDATAPLNIRVEVSEEDLATLDQAASSPHNTAEYMRLAALEKAFRDLNAKASPPERNAEEMKRFCSTVLSVTTGDDREYRQAIQDVLFWLNYPEVVMYHLPPENA